MKVLRLLFLPLATAAALPALAAAEPLLPFEAAAPAATPPSLYSFADMCRLAAAGEAFPGLGVGEAETLMRVATAPAANGAPELRFSVSARHDDARWALLLAGLCTCAWVAHRRLASPY